MTAARLEAIDREAYLKALVAVAQADQELNEAELEFLRQQADAFELDLDAFLGSPDVDLVAVRERADPVTRRMVIRDCITLATIDGDLDDAERARIRAVAEQLGVGSARVDALEEWLERFSRMLHEGEMLLVSDE